MKIGSKLLKLIKKKFMMGYGYGYGGMMGGGLGSLVALVVLVDLILLGIWLYKQINK